MRSGRRQVAAHQETADAYAGVILHLGARHRVVACAKGLQWIVQVRRGERRGRARWTGLRYCTTREALIAASHALCGALDAETVAALKALPDRIGGAR